MRKTKMQKGITLIALIITIIILLILAVVTIGSIKNSNIITYAQNASIDYNKKKNEEESIVTEYESLIEENYLKSSKEPISSTESFIGYYADVDGNGIVDGIIYADLAFDGSGKWADENGAYSYSKKEILNNYYVSKKSYLDKNFKENSVIAPIDKVEGNERFYVMALKDFQTEDYYWYENAMHDNMSDYATTTSVDFGKGKENTATMMKKIYGEGLGDEDVWKNIASEVALGWFVPSRGEWGAFGDFAAGQGMTISNYANYGVSYFYWSSSQNNEYSVWNASFEQWRMVYNGVGTNRLVRLSTTF